MGEKKMREEEEVNEMLVCEDKYEVYRLGFKRGADRGYDSAHQQEQETVRKLQARISYIGTKYANAAYEIKGLKATIKALEFSLDDKIQRIVVLRHVNEDLKLRQVKDEHDTINGE